MKLKQIQIDQIDRQDRLYLIESSPSFDIDWNDIVAVGNPIWLQKNETGKYRVVDGIGLLNYLVLDKKATTVNALILDDINELEIWKRILLKRITENNCSVFAVMQSLLHLFEKLEIESSPVELNKYLKKAGFPAKSIQRERLEQMVQLLLSDCGFADLYSLKHKEIVRLVKLSRQDLRNYAQLFEGMILKGNKLNSMLLLLEELDRGYQISSADILRNDVITAILKDVPLHQRYKQIKNELLGLRWPKLNSVTARWQKNLNDLNLSKEIQIVVDPYFEADNLEFYLKASNYQDFSRLQNELFQKSKSDQFQELFRFI